MARRYTDVEPKSVVDLEPGDEIIVRKRVTHIVRSWGQDAHIVTVTWDDGTMEDFDLASDPSIEVTVKKVKD